MKPSPLLNARTLQRNGTEPNLTPHAPRRPPLIKPQNSRLSKFRTQLRNADAFDLLSGSGHNSCESEPPVEGCAAPVSGFCQYSAGVVAAGEPRRQQVCQILSPSAFRLEQSLSRKTDTKPPNYVPVNVRSHSKDHLETVFLPFQLHKPAGTTSERALQQTCKLAEYSTMAPRESHQQLREIYGVCPKRPQGQLRLIVTDSHGPKQTRIRRVFRTPHNVNPGQVREVAGRKLNFTSESEVRRDGGKPALHSSLEHPGGDSVSVANNRETTATEEPERPHKSAGETREQLGNVVRKLRGNMERFMKRESLLMDRVQKLEEENAQLRLQLQLQRGQKL